MTRQRIILFYALMLLNFRISSAPSDVYSQWFRAAQSGDLKKIENLLPLVRVNAQNITGKTALIIASFFGRANIVKFLLQAPDININLQDKLRNTALLAATKIGNINIVQLLLLAPDIDITIQDNTRATALQYAFLFGFRNIARLILHAPVINITQNRKTSLVRMLATTKALRIS